MSRRDERAFRRELAEVINRHSAEAGSNTPDFILANYLTACLDAFDVAVEARSIHAGRIV
ncbi:hypothetical protein [Rhodococcoides fascians]|uniref:hypothetical protein n=1 Tax=Rhodococcoides fascians TaxID=1828 RepID=UPI000566722B|nr:hypothetical protein [Rhodococcus fascians]